MEDCNTSQIVWTQTSEDNIENTERQAFSIAVFLNKQSQYNSSRRPSLFIFERCILECEINSGFNHDKYGVDTLLKWQDYWVARNSKSLWWIYSWWQHVMARSFSLPLPTLVCNEWDKVKIAFLWIAGLGLTGWFCLVIRVCVYCIFFYHE